METSWDELIQAKEEFDTAQFELIEAQAALEDAQKQLEEATITAPFDGIIAEVNAEVGDLVSPNKPVIILVDPSELEINAIVDELDVFKVKPGQKARIIFDALPMVKLQGEVKNISPLAIKQAGVVSYPITISVKPPGNLQLKGGLSASVDIIVTKKENVLLVPNRAVMRKGRERKVQVVVDDEIQERVVKVGESNEQWTEIISGLKEGEKVLVGLQTPTVKPRLRGLPGIPMPPRR